MILVKELIKSFVELETAVCLTCCIAILGYDVVQLSKTLC